MKRAPFTKFLAAACATLTLCAGVVHAAGISNFTVAVSSMAAGATMDQTVTFVTPSGVDSAGDTIVLTWGAAADLSGLSIPSDVFLGVDDDALCNGPFGGQTLAASASTGVWGVSRTGNAITFSPPTDAVLGTIPAGMCVQMLLNGIVNPSSSGSLSLQIGGGFGDVGYGSSAVSDGTSVGVTACVGSCDSGGGGDSPISGSGEGDTAAPTIYNVHVTGLTETSARISWNTDESANGRVDWGRYTSYEIGALTDTGFASSHTFEVTGLIPGVTYYARLQSVDIAGNTAVYEPVAFTTSDTTAPVIADLQVVQLSSTSVTIQWTTAEPSTTVLDYGLTESYELGTVSDSTFTTDHTIILSGLEPGTTYHVRARSADAAGNEGVSDDLSFTTLIDLPPSNVTLTATAQTEDILLEWELPSDEDLAGVVVVYRTDRYPTNPEDGTVLLNALATSYVHGGVSMDTTYYYGVFAYDAAGQFASGALDRASVTSILPIEEIPVEEIPEEIPVEEVPAEKPPAEVVAPEEASSEDAPSVGADSGTTSGDSGDVDSTTSGETDGARPPLVVSEPPFFEERPESILEPSEPGQVSEKDIRFLVGAANILLSPRADDSYAVLPDFPLLIVTNLAQTEGVVSVRFSFNGSLYNLAKAPSKAADRVGFAAFKAKSSDVVSAQVEMPTQASRYLGSIQVEYEGGYTQSFEYEFEVVPLGFVFSSLKQDRAERLADARVELFTMQSGRAHWDAPAYAQVNPLTTNQQGGFGWYVPNGTYEVVATKTGFESASSGTFEVTDNLARPTIGMQPIPPPLPDAVAALVEPYTAVSEALLAIPAVQTTVESSPAVLTVVAVSGVASLAAGFNLIPFLQYLFTSPALFFWRRRRKGFGVVYHAYTKMPVDLAIVRLFRLNDDKTGTGKLVQTRVTDTAGRYVFLVQPGWYRLSVVRQPFTFPSAFLAHERTDGAYLDVYHGEPLRVDGRDAVITANIPLDPSDDAKRNEPNRVVWARRLRRGQELFALAGLLVSIAVWAIAPTMLALSMVGIQLVMYALVRRLAAARKPKSWGIVYNEKTGRPLTNAIVRLFEPKYNKLIETAVTDWQGRYHFLLGPSTYYSVFERTGYDRKEIRPIDFSAKREPAEFAQNVGLHPR